MKILIASDHGGFYLKEDLKNHLTQKGHQVTDYGNLSFNPNDDYTDFVIPLAEAIAKNSRAIGIVLGRSGNGEAIAANKIKGAYAAHCLSSKMAKRAKEHNNANIIALGAEYTSHKTAKHIVDVFIKTSFSKATRHTRRVAAIKRYESSHSK